MNDDRETRGSATEELPERQSASSNSPTKPPGKKQVSGRPGLAPTDLVSLPSEGRKLVNWLIRRKAATYTELQDASVGAGQNLDEILASLMKQGFIVEKDIDGALHYCVSFRGSPRRGPRGLGKELWNQLDFGEE